MMSLSFPKPKDDKIFEAWCWRIFQKEFSLEDFQIFGRGGQSQEGVDLIGRTPSGDLVGIQCKLRTLAPARLKVADIEKDVASARGFQPQLARFIVATTAERDKNLQKYAAQATADHPSLPIAVYAWQDIEDILNANPTLAAELYPSLPLAKSPRVPGLGATASAEVTVAAAVSSGHEEINRATDLLRQGSPGAAIALLEKLRRERWDELAMRERYRLCVNLGLSHLAKHDHLSAASHLLQAEVLQPSDNEASAFGALGHLVAGQDERAHEKAEALCRGNPYLPVAQAVRIASAPVGLSYEELKSAAPEIILKNPDVARALHLRASREGNLEEAESVLRAVEGGDQMPLVAFHLGTVVLYREMNASRMTGVGPIATDRGRVEEARTLFTTAIPKLVESVHEYATALYNRAQANLLLGDGQSAYLDFKSAYEAAPQEADLALAYASGALERGETATALGILEETFKLDGRLRTRLLLALALERERKQSTLKRQEQILSDGLPEINSLERNLRLQYMLQLLAVLSGRQLLDRKRAEDLVAQIHDPLEAAVVRASALMKIGERELAGASIDAVLSELNRVEEWAWRREVAVILEELDRPAEALQLWLQLYTPGVDGPEARHLLGCARDSERDDVVLQVTEQLRAGGVFASNVVALEVDTLVEYSEYAAARDILLDQLRRTPEDLQARTRLLNLAVVQNWFDIVNEHASGLPDSSEVSTAEFGYQIVGAYSMLAQPEAAARYAYELTRRFPDSSLSHRALIVAIFGPRAGRLELPRPTIVGVDYAVRYRDKSTGDSNWIVIEGGLNPQLSRSEYSPSHPLSLSMMGKVVGEEFLLPGSSLRQRTGVIEAVQHKIVFRANESMERWPERFPDTWMLERFSVQEDEEFRSLLQELLEFYKQLQEKRKEAEQLYQMKKCPLSGLATIAGKAIPEVVEYLAQARDMPVHCIDGTKEQIARASLAIDKAHTVVIDPVALATVSLLWGELSFDFLPFQCVVTEGTLDVFRGLLWGDVDDPRKQGYLGFDGERLVLTELNPEVERRVQEQRRAFLELVEAQCEIVGGRALASIEPSFRAKLRKVLGSAVAEAFALAHLRRIPLWTDDFVTGVLGSAEQMVQHIWTQAVCLKLDDLQRISHERLNSITIKLCQWGYKFTSIKPSTIVAASNLCDWHPDKEPLRSVLERFEDAWDTTETTSFVVAAFAEMWRSAPIDEAAMRVTLRICNLLLAKPNGRQILRSVRGRLDKAFGMNIVRARSAKLAIDSSLASPGPSGLFLP